MELLQGVLVMVVLVVFDLPDAWGSLRYSQSPRSMRPKSDPASRSPALSPLGLWNPLQVASQFQSPLSSVSRNLAQDPFGLQEKQLLQGPVKPLDWRYPVVPEVQRELAVDFQLRQPVTPSSVAVQCSENRVLVEVQQDLFSNGQLIQPTGLSLGGCPVVGQDTEARVLIFEYELQDCNSMLMLNEDELVYTFSLTYTPEALADDWSYQRPSNSYFLGGVINIEASVKVYNHVPLRVFVDSCVATQGPDVNSLPRYSFIVNHGCFVDAKATASSSRFMPRAQEDKIQFQLEAFMFQESSSPYVYITCILKATIASVPSDAKRKSCSFANGWFAADGNNQVCGCCDSTCGPDGGFASPYGDDWSYQRPSNSYFLGGVINIEASVKVYNHVPLRVFVDSCVATQGPDVNSLPRYSFIENHGCFVDAKATASSSRFMPRAQEDKLQFQLEAFMFQESSSPYIYITCILKATIASVPSDAQRKSCSFANGWFAADGNNQVCGCCDSSCGSDGGFASPYGDAGRPDCSELAAAATHDDGADAFTVHLHLQSPHSVPEKLQTDLRPALARRRRPPSPMSPSQPLSPPEPRTHRTGGGGASLPERFLAVLVTGRDMSRGKYEGRCAALSLTSIIHRFHCGLLHVITDGSPSTFILLYIDANDAALLFNMIR
ncbi:Zona pellucida sperm-binding protein 3 [Anabarilius grahami]|uniref:Zona pellucida sperm-binding protein 3 n=1 Tax=Anabarilius grahami TaxID=495550 RepID=A0A3N0XLP7_ANAGA|nr:Zona pellucida sperm-binding protein 3 [Anabarilius grahami]